MSSSIKLTMRDNVAILTLNSPERHNSLSAHDIELAVNAVRQASKEARALIVTGSGEATFCAGAFLGDMQSGKLNPDIFERFTDALFACNIPTICALNGNAFGGGVEIALSCDFRIAKNGIRMQIPAAQIGICYNANGMKRFVAVLGLDTTRHLLLTALPLTGQQLITSGAVQETTSADQLDEQAFNKAQHLASLAPLSVGSMKELLNRISVNQWDDNRYKKLSEACNNSLDLQEGLAAKREKRIPCFIGQ